MNSFKNKKGVLFDLDGTVIDSTDGIFNALNYMLDSLNMPHFKDSNLFRFIGPSIGATLKEEYGFGEEQSIAAVNIYREYYSKQGLFECEAYLGMNELLKAIKASGKKIALATKKPEVFSKQIIENLGFADYFDAICGSSLNDGHNSKTYIIERAVELLGIEKQDAVMIGDTKYDCMGANEAEVDCIGVLYGFGSRDDLMEHGAAAIVETVGELKAILCEENDEKYNIAFSPPDITELEINEVIDTLKSGWITTGAKTKLFENRISEYCHADKAVCLNSATAAMELTLRLLNIGEGDEVITSAYTYTASASVICHVGATPIMADVAKGSFEMDYDKLGELITDKTKAIIPVDIAGVPCDYDRLFEVVNAPEKKALFKGNNKIAEELGRVAIIADSSHAFGAEYKGKSVGEIADFACFSFHAVKNLTTGEGGAVVFSATDGKNIDEIYKQYMLLSLHGQSKDALAKTQLGAWEYDIISPAYKCNMTDIMAAIGLSQLSRYDEMLQRRKEIIAKYDEGFKGTSIQTLTHFSDGFSSSGHLYLTRLIGKDIQFRNKAIIKLAEMGISANVHYKPLPMLTAYKNLGFDIADYPNAYEMYQNEITLPLHTSLTDGEVDYIIEQYLRIVECH